MPLPPLPALAHDLRTPLHGILGLLELLRATPLDDEQQGHVAALGEAATALLAMAEDAIALARLEAGAEPPLVRAPCDVRALLDGVARTLAPLAAARGLALDVERDVGRDDGAPTCVDTDAGSVRRVLLNLAGNAIRVTHRGGVRLRARAATDGALALDVVDTGPGLTPAQRARLFRAWARPLAEDGLDDAPQGGAGLGLVLADALATRLGGRLAVESVHGAGSTFTLLLPPAPPATG